MTSVLVVDDEASLRTMVQVNLAASGYEVIAARRGEEVLALAGAKKPDLVLLDIKMPGMSGWDVLKALKANSRLRDIPVIVMTAFIKDSEESRAAAIHVASFLAKPFGIQELLEQIRQALQKKSL